jgi:hypothetical protein
MTTHTVKEWYGNYYVVDGSDTPIAMCSRHENAILIANALNNANGEAEKVPRTGVMPHRFAASPSNYMCSICGGSEHERIHHPNQQVA